MIFFYSFQSKYDWLLIEEKREIFPVAPVWYKQDSSICEIKIFLLSGNLSITTQFDFVQIQSIPVDYPLWLSNNLWPLIREIFFNYSKTIVSISRPSGVNFKGWPLRYGEFVIYFLCELADWWFRFLFHLFSLTESTFYLFLHLNQSVPTTLWRKVPTSEFLLCHSCVLLKA